MGVGAQQFSVDGWVGGWVRRGFQVDWTRRCYMGAGRCFDDRALCREELK